MIDGEAIAAKPQPAPTKARSRGHQDPLETWSTKFVRKFAENPLVPIGCLLTCGALVMSAYKLRQGKSKEMNHWLRARVALQGVTVVALLVGSMQLQKANKEAEAVRLRDRVAETEKAKERMEFEKRLLEAERVTKEEEEIRRARTVSTVVKEKKSSSWWPWSRGKDPEDKT